jgi:hypothetical protein
VFESQDGANDFSLLQNVQNGFGESAEFKNEWSYYLNSIYMLLWHNRGQIRKIIAKSSVSIKYFIFLSNLS